jgi:hypothetical protein
VDKEERKSVGRARRLIIGEDRGGSNGDVYKVGLVVCEVIHGWGERECARAVRHSAT